MATRPPSAEVSFFICETAKQKDLIQATPDRYYTELGKWAENMSLQSSICPALIQLAQVEEIQIQALAYEKLMEEESQGGNVAVALNDFQRAELFYYLELTGCNLNPYDKNLLSTNLEIPTGNA